MTTRVELSQLTTNNRTVHHRHRCPNSTRLSPFNTVVRAAMRICNSLLRSRVFVAIVPRVRRRAIQRDEQTLNAVRPATERSMTTVDIASTEPITGTTFAVTREAPTAARVAVLGNVIVATRQALKQRVLDLLHDGVTTVTLDLAAAGYIDNSGLGVLVSIAKKCRDAGGALWLEGANEDLATLFAITKLDTLLNIRLAPGAPR
ncbi:MAG: anti-anti-sigma factor [Gemmatimonadetes bacterium]|nr:anti-anti-sigma factor [Gemmatimonadota bacterium]